MTKYEEFLKTLPIQFTRREATKKVVEQAKDVTKAAKGATRKGAKKKSK